jgi:hypothetical protein
VKGRQKNRNHNKEINNMTDKERSVKDIRQDIATEGENLSRVVTKIDERIKENLNWHTYMQNSPYWMLGAAVGCGFLAARLFKPQMTPTQRVIESLAREIPRSLGSLLGKTAGPGVIKLALLGVATKIVADRLMIPTNPVETAAEEDTDPLKPFSVSPPSQKEEEKQ